MLWSYQLGIAYSKDEGPPVAAASCLPREEVQQRLMVVYRPASASQTDWKQSSEKLKVIQDFDQTRLVAVFDVSATAKDDIDIDILLIMRGSDLRPGRYIQHVQGWP
jgi:hypothetical protein